MKKFTLFLLFVSFSSMSCMTGHWEVVGKMNSFAIDLVQTGNHISGKYCFITNNGNRIDCADKGDGDNIKGDVENGVAEIQFESTFGGSGAATAKISNAKLIYIIKDKTPFVQASMSVPSKIELSKK
ncbi:hypothetical protein [Enterobacter asburiae]|uniref:hypothetical protein n=1 Tax=Enterobacter asburiae TaxID=61645 RepID=UPI003F56D68A